MGALREGELVVVVAVTDADMETDDVESVPDSAHDDPEQRVRRAGPGKCEKVSVARWAVEVARVPLSFVLPHLFIPHPPPLFSFLSSFLLSSLYHYFFGHTTHLVVPVF